MTPAEYDYLVKRFDLMDQRLNDLEKRMDQLSSESLEHWLDLNKQVHEGGKLLEQVHEDVIEIRVGNALRG